MAQLAGKVAVITGGGSGIGRATAERFAREGALVIVADLIADRADETVAHIAGMGGEALAVAADVSDAQAVEALAQRALATYGQVDILVNNAAISQGDDIREIDEATWDRNLAVVLKSAYLCSRALVPQMIARRTGAIVNIASVNGLAAFGEEAYSAGKAGMISLTQNMAVKYGQYGVRANCLCPGTVRTPIWVPRVAENPRIFEQLAQWYPLGRVGEPEDVANAALFLASDQAAWITGSVLNVDGGLMAGRFQMSRDLTGQGE
jgi:NAD(P)-dependent dehydrogenase (short-subunit alcohol dehydrogenase family)